MGKYINYDAITMQFEELQNGDHRLAAMLSVSRIKIQVHKLTVSNVA